MGFYILNAHEHPPHGKVQTLIEKHGGQPLQGPPAWAEIPEGMLAVAVVTNRPFDAAAVMYSEQELNDIVRDLDVDLRPLRWLLVPEAEVWKLNERDARLYLSPGARRRVGRYPGRP